MNYSCYYCGGKVYRYFEQYKVGIACCIKCFEAFEFYAAEEDITYKEISKSEYKLMLILL